MSSICDRCRLSVSQVYRPRGSTQCLCNKCRHLYLRRIVSELLERLESIAPITEEKIKERKRFLLQGKSPKVTKAALEYLNTLTKGSFPEVGARGLALKYGVGDQAIMLRVKEIAEIFNFHKELWKLSPSARAQIQHYLALLEEPV